MYNKLMTFLSQLKTLLLLILTRHATSWSVPAQDRICEFARMLNATIIRPMDILITQIRNRKSRKVLIIKTPMVVPAVPYLSTDQWEMPKRGLIKVIPSTLAPKTALSSITDNPTMALEKITAQTTRQRTRGLFRTSMTVSTTLVDVISDNQGPRRMHSRRPTALTSPMPIRVRQKMRTTRTLMKKRANLHYFPAHSNTSLMRHGLILHLLGLGLLLESSTGKSSDIQVCQILH